MTAPISVNDVATYARHTKDAHLPYMDAVEEACEALKTHFPAPLRADYAENWSEFGL